jgi:hypothetical protein
MKPALQKMQKKSPAESKKINTTKRIWERINIIRRVAANEDKERIKCCKNNEMNRHQYLPFNNNSMVIVSTLPLKDND